MVMAMGVGASAGLFHLMTHAYFKAMLFLGSGSVIHGMEGSSVTTSPSPGYADDGGAAEVYAVYAITFLIGCLAISGIPPFAGFWSKDETWFCLPPTQFSGCWLANR